MDFQSFQAYSVLKGAFKRGAFKGPMKLKNNCNLFERISKVKKNGVFLLE